MPPLLDLVSVGALHIYSLVTQVVVQKSLSVNHHGADMGACNLTHFFLEDDGHSSGNHKPLQDNGFCKKRILGCGHLLYEY